MDQEDFQLLISFAIHQKPGAGFAHVLNYGAISLEAKYRKRRNGGIVQRRQKWVSSGRPRSSRFYRRYNFTRPSHPSPDNGVGCGKKKCSVP
jgi:hypothetical protein